MCKQTSFLKSVGVKDAFSTLPTLFFFFVVRVNNYFPAILLYQIA
jgi:hypothetical protein